MFSSQDRVVGSRISRYHVLYLSFSKAAAAKAHMLWRYKLSEFCKVNESANYYTNRSLVGKKPIRTSGPRANSNQK